MLHWPGRTSLFPREGGDVFPRLQSISPISEAVWWAHDTGVVTQAVRSPVRPATRGRRVVSRASGRGIAGRMVVSRCASLDLPAPGGPSSRMFGAQRLHHVHPGMCPRPW
jgi:hypothetical protein